MQQSESQQLIASIDDQITYIESNRAQRNNKYKQCMSHFKQFLQKQTEQFESTENSNDHNKALVSQAFESTFNRVLNASDLTIRKIKQTYNQKKQFWDNVIKVNSDLADLQLKRDFYMQKKEAEQGYLEAVDRQKDKHKPYKALIITEKKKQGLRDYQLQNRTFEEKVIQGTTTLQQWQSISNNANRYNSAYNYRPSEAGRGVLNEFMDEKYRKVLHIAEAQPLRPKYDLEVENSTSFLDNFVRKR